MTQPDIHLPQYLLDSIQKIPASSAGQILQALYWYQRGIPADAIDPQASLLLQMIIDYNEQLSLHRQQVSHARSITGSMGGKATAKKKQKKNQPPKPISVPPKGFDKPTPAQVTEYLNQWCQSQNKPAPPPNYGERFCSFYDSKDWLVGKNKMKDWKAAARGWIERDTIQHPVQFLAARQQTSIMEKHAEISRCEGAIALKNHDMTIQQIQEEKTKNILDFSDWLQTKGYTTTNQQIIDEYRQYCLS